MISSVSKGDDLENKVYEYFRKEIDEDRFLFRASCCRIYQKKGYYSKDRESDIIFDVSIEIFYPDEQEYSLVFLIECKNYKSAVKVDDLEEFYAKAEQVASANSKAILITSNSFQGSARRYARSKGIGLARFTDPSKLKWELRRSPSAAATSSSQGGLSEVEAAFAGEGDEVRIFDFVFESANRATNSLWDFFEDLVAELCSDAHPVEDVLNNRSKLDPLVPYISLEQMEDRAGRIFAAINYMGGAIDLDAVADLISGLKVTRSDIKSKAMLGVASFDSGEITLFADEESKRQRFTLAHELSHFLLGHGNFMRRDTCDQSDLAELKGASNRPREVRRMEYQANLLASCLLMPRQDFIRSFFRVAKELDLHDRGFGHIYYDGQTCNAQVFMMATSSLMQTYSVSRTAARIRLETLGFLRNAQVVRRVL